MTSFGSFLPSPILSDVGSSDRRLTVVDLFAGCGGVSLGFEYAGWKPVLACELNDHARHTYLRNREARFPKLAEFTFDDIEKFVDLSGVERRLVKAYGIGEIDAIVGGPPCQGFSGIGHRRTFRSVARKDMPSNHLFLQMVRVIEGLRPRSFVFENVRGLKTGKWTKTGDPGEIWDDVRTAFGIKGYGIHFDVVHASSFGVPQNRPRLILVGIRDDVPLDGPVLPPRSAQIPPNPVDVFGDLVDRRYMQMIKDTPAGRLESEFYPRDPVGPFQEWFRTSVEGTVAARGAALTEQRYSRHSAPVLRKFAYMLENDGLIHLNHQTRKFRQTLLKRRWDNGPNITVTSLPDDYVHFSQPRSLTVREWARLQTFPDWYEFAGPRTTGGRRRAGDPSTGNWLREVPKYTQIGNAVPVWMAYSIAKHLRKLLGDKRGRNALAS
ncbi:MAG: Modification methylase HaeIII [Nitrospira sp.]|nr:Modification methylase HaeIII [Nitrospira sp.]